MPTIQKSTHQVPCGPHSLIDYANEKPVPMFSFFIYTLLNYKSNWESGKSFKLSYLDLAKLSGVFKKNKKGEWTGKSHVANAIRWLVENGWLIKKFNANGGPNSYQIVHHNCAPEEVPLDADGRPKKCAVPHGEGSAFQRMFDGEISWKACLYHTVAKVVSDWTTGVVRFTIKESQKWMRFSNQTICDIRKSLLENGLLEELGNRFRGFIAKIIPAPYEKRRKRADKKAVKGMKSDDKYYYSYNGIWRISRNNGEIHTLEATNWRFASEYELERVNSKIYVDFMQLREMIESLQMFRQPLA